MTRAACILLVVSVGCAGPRAGQSRDTRAGATDLAIDAAHHSGIAGFVRDVGSGSGIPFASLTVTAIDQPSEDMIDTTGSRGEFHISLEPGRYRILARYGDMTATASEVVVLEGKLTRLHLDLDSRSPRPADPLDGHRSSAATGTIAGRIVSVEDGAPFVGAVVSAVAAGQAQATMAMTDEAGRFHIPALRPGSYMVTVYYHLIDRGNIELRRSGIEVVADETTAVQLDIDLRVQR